MRILVIGSGAREHALVWALSHDPEAEKIFAAPGNDGMAALAERVAIPETDAQALFRWAFENHIGLVVIGSEKPLALGLADLLRGANIPVLGPGREGARLRTSRAFAKDFMVRNAIAAPRHRLAASPGDVAIALAVLGERVTLKPDGASERAFHVLCDSRDEAETRARALLRGADHTPAITRLVIEERLEGAACSLYAFCDGSQLLPFPVLRTQTRLEDRDTGLETAGMGAFAPIDLAEEELESLERDVLNPFLTGLQQERFNYRGFIGFDLIFTQEGPRVLDFEICLGEPAAQTLLPVMKAGFLAAALATANGQLDEEQLEWDGRHAVSVVLASGGYPNGAGDPHLVSGLDKPTPSALVFIGDTEKRPDGWFASPCGRPFSVTGLGASLEEARAAAYNGALGIEFEGRHMRSDIAGEPSKSMPSTFAPESTTPLQNGSRVWIFLADEADKVLLEKAASTLADFGVESRFSVVSPHRNPDRFLEELRRAEPETPLYIVAVDGAEHLSGLISSHTVKPVIGVPLSTRLGGVDSVLSVMQAPIGFPAATVSVDGAENAAYLALQILALSNAALAKKLSERRLNWTHVAEKAAVPAHD